jgi:hypothetical protein
MSVRLPDQMVVAMPVKTEASTTEVDPAVYTQAQQLVRQCGTETREAATASVGQPLWLEPWPQMPMVMPVETVVAAPWIGPPAVAQTAAAPAVVARPLETGWSKVRPDVMQEALTNCIQGMTSSSIGVPAVTVAPPPPSGNMLACHCELCFGGKRSGRQLCSYCS